MLALRSAIRQPQRLARFYSKDNYDGSPAGLAGESDKSGSFDNRERASENFYIKQHEKESLKALRDEIQKREKELGELKEKADKLDH